MQDILEELYASADPLCVKAARQIEMVESEANLLLEASRLMMDGLMEIYKVAMSRDIIPKIKHEDLLKEYSLRLKECGMIANDTLSLPTVYSAFRGLQD